MAFEQISFRRYGRFYRNAQKYASRQEVLISTYLILSLFTVSFFAAVFIRPTAVRIASLWREIQDKRDVYYKLEGKIRDLEKAQELVGAIENDSNYINRALPSNPEFSRFLKQIDYLVNLHGLEMTSAKYPPLEIYSESESTSSAAQLIGYKFSLGLKGNFQNIRSFLEDVQKIDRITDLALIKIIPVSSQRREAVVELSLDLVDSEIYSFPERENY